MNKEIIISDVGDLGIVVEMKDSGPEGKKGSPPRHEISENGLGIRFENPDGSWGEFIDLADSLDYDYLKNKPVIGGTQLEGILDLKDVGAEAIKKEDIKKLI